MKNRAMKPKKDLIDAAISDGSMDRLNQLLSASHILLCEANTLIEEASDLMINKGLMLGILKKRHNDFVKCADAYFKEFSSMITEDKTKINMFSDLDDFDQSFRAWAKVPSGWKPKDVEP